MVDLSFFFSIFILQHFIFIYLKLLYFAGRARIEKVSNTRMTNITNVLKPLVSQAKWHVICVDRWSKKGLTASFLGISDCFLDLTRAKPMHVLLRLKKLQHPHNGTNFVACIEKCLVEKWNIPLRNVLLVISDNGANIVKAAKLLKAQASISTEGDLNNDERESNEKSETDLTENEENEENDDDVEGSDSDNNDSNTIELPPDSPFNHLPCIAYTLQLVIKQSFKHYDSVLSKARKLVGTMRKSLVITEKLIELVGKGLVTDCCTRWNSTHQMLKRLLSIKEAVNQVLTTNGFDTLLASEWLRIEELVNVLEPFTLHTNLLQSDAMSLSSVVPALLDLKCHLEQMTDSQALKGDAYRFQQQIWKLTGSQ